MDKVPNSPHRRGPATSRRIAVLIVLTSLFGGLLSIGPWSPAAGAATTVPGQNDNVRVTPMARLVGLGPRQITGFDTDPAGNVYASGNGWDANVANRGSRHITTQGTDTSLGDNFLIKMNPAGDLVWSIPLPGDSVKELKVDNAGNVFAVGVTDGTLGGVFIEAPGFPGQPHVGAYVAKFKADGTGAVWAMPAPFLRSVGIDPAGGYVYIAGKNNASPLIARINASTGATMWQRNFGGNASPFLETFTDVTVLGDGSAVAAGYFQGQLYLDYPGPQQNPIDEANGATIAVRYDVNGNRQWYKQMGGFDAFNRTRVVALPDGNIAIAGKSRFYNAQFGGITPPATDYDFAFVTKLNATNTSFIWTSFVTTDPTPKLNPNFDLSGIDVDANGNIAFGTAFEDAAHVHNAYVNGASNSPAPASVPLSVDGFGDITASLTPSGTVRFARATNNADLPGNEGVQSVTREVRFGQNNDVIQAGSTGRPTLLGVGDPNAMTASPEVAQAGVYIARLRIGGSFVQRPPEPPTFAKAWGNQTETNSDTATVSWKAPADIGGSPITGYRIAGSCGKLVPGPDVPDVIVTAPATAVRVVIPGLPSNCRWAWWVRASNATGNGPQSEVAPMVGFGSDESSNAYRPLSEPLRIMDTRDGTGPVPIKKLGPGESIDLFVDRFQTPGYRSRAVALNVTAVFPSQSTHLTVYPRGEKLPATSNLNAGAGTVIPNFVFSKIDANGYITVRNNAGSVDVIIDMLGFYEQFAQTYNTTYEPLVPFRLLDTRFATGVGTTTPIGPNGHATFQVAGRGGVPAGNAAKAVVVNLTGTGPSAATHLTFSTSPSSVGGISNLNLATGQTAANLAIANVAADGTITVWNNSGNAHAIVDVVGYFHQSAASSGDPITGNVYRAISPARALDTRDGTGRPGGVGGKVGPGGVITLPVGTQPELQSDGKAITAVVLNVTGVSPSADTHLTVYPGTSPVPVASNLNLSAGGVRANLVVVKVGTDGTVAFRNNSGQVDIVADVVGSFVSAGPT